MKRMFSRAIDKREYEEKSQDFEAYQKGTLICIWKKIIWYRTFSAQKKCGEYFL
jgi:hypothetical protein